MMLSLAFIVCMSSVFMEVQLVKSIPFLAKIYDEGFMGIPGVWVNNIASLGLSAVVGMVFQAQGIAIMVGGISSIFVSNVYFNAKGTLNKKGITIESFKAEQIARVEATKEWWAKNKVHFENLAKTIMIFIKVVTAPIRTAIAVNDAVHNGKAEVIALKDRTAQKFHRAA